jgi:hypothetical protein
MMNTSKSVGFRLLRCLLVFGMLYFFSTSINAQTSTTSGYNNLISGFNTNLPWKSEAQATDVVLQKVKDLHDQLAQTQPGSQTAINLEGRTAYYKTIYRDLTEGKLMPEPIRGGLGFLYSLTNTFITTDSEKKQLYDESVQLLKE